MIAMPSQSNSCSMIKAYFRSALRFFLKNKGYSLLNISGLVVGISFSCMLLTFVAYELSFDKHHHKSDRTFRMMTVDTRNAADPSRYNTSVAAAGPEIVKTFPEAETMVRLYRFIGQVVFQINGDNFMERDWYAVDSTFFDVFDYEFIHGDRSTALSRPSSIVLTASAAKQYFGTTDVVGRSFDRSNVGPLTVTGVLKDPPLNSHLYFNVLISTNYNEPFWKRHIDNWTFDPKTFLLSYTYVVLNDRRALPDITARLQAFAQLHFGAAQNQLKLELQPLREVYLHSSDVKEMHRITRYGNLTYLYIFSSMAALLVVIVSMNYINLATTRATARSREIGVRKVAGAQRQQLIVQYLVESLSITSMAMVLAIGVMDAAFPYFNEITGRDFDIRWDTLAHYIPGLLIISAIIGLVSGIYPALYLAGLRPILALKGKVTTGNNASLRQILVVKQFVLSIAMIAATLVVGEQMEFIQSKDLGFQQDNLMVIDINSGNGREKFETIKNEFRRIPGVSNVAASSRVPGEWKNIAQLYVRTSDAFDSANVYFMGFDEDMLDTYKLRLADGRFFDHHTKGDSTSILINQAAAQTLSLKDPLGKVISLSSPEGEFNVTVIGVLEDFNFQSLHLSVAPIIIGAWNNPVQSIDYFTIKFSGDIDRVVEEATAVHKKFDERTPIEYNFLDQQLNSRYSAEKRASMIFRLAAVLSVFVACLGLSGLAAYNIERRVRELGIRKVLGATHSQLFMMLSASYIKQISIAFAIATPIAWLSMREWLESFQYRIPLGLDTFLIAGLAAFVVALITIGYRMLAASRSNPVDALRNGD